MRDLFVSHTWRHDALGRNTHTRARALVIHLRKLGWTVWFDEDDMRCGNVDIAMARGIEAAKAVIVCITRSYMEKVNNGLALMQNRDNCAKEWSYAMTLGKALIPVIFESELLAVANWPPGVVSMQLGCCMYVDASDADWDRAALATDMMLNAAGVTRSPPTPGPRPFLQRIASRRMSDSFFPKLSEIADESGRKLSTAMQGGGRSHERAATPDASSGCLRLLFRPRLASK